MINGPILRAWLWSLSGVILAGALLLPAVTHPARAAPFCLAQGKDLKCIYYDGVACARDAAAANAVCTQNPQSGRLPSTGNNAYCLVTADNARVCGYVDAVLCGQDALKQHGACVRGVGTPQPVPNVYNPNAGR